MVLKRNRHIIILTIFFLGVTLSFYSQTLKKPILGFHKVACATSSYNNFTVNFDFKGSSFNSDNVFEIQMSDVRGDFSSPIVVGKVKNKNDSFLGIKGIINFPKVTSGSGYKIRIRATSPERISPESDIFEAYYTDLTQPLVLNDDKHNFFLCGGTPRKLTLNYRGSYNKFQWFRNNKLISGETGKTITISKSGKYYVQFDKGTCSDSSTGNIHSNIITVSNLEIDLKIKSLPLVALCSDEKYTLVASIDNPEYVYKWYKDDKLIEGLPDYTPVYTTEKGNSFGNYYVSIKSKTGGCESKSQLVKITQRIKNFKVIAKNGTTRAILPKSSTVLTVEHTAKSPTYQWYTSKGLKIEGATMINLRVDSGKIGAYYLEVTDNSEDCPITKKSSLFTVLGIQKIKTSVVPLSYIPCTSLETVLSSKIEAITAEGKLYKLTDKQLKSLNIQWFINNKKLDKATKNTYKVSSYKENGVYAVKTIGSLFKSEYKEEKIQLGLKEVKINSDSSNNVLCAGNSITISVPDNPNFTYKWFKNDVFLSTSNPLKIEVKQIGNYKVIYEAFGCKRQVEITIKPFESKSVKIKPNNKLILEKGGVVKAFAFGADSYEWFDKKGKIISTNEVISISKTGVYTLKAKQGKCFVERKLSVINDDGKYVISNILTPFNADGVNDTWKLPNRLAFNSDISVKIYEASGQEVLSTNNYQNDWPNDIREIKSSFFYFKIFKRNKVIKSGTISIFK